MVVLSLFDGLSCGQIALKELGVKVDKYYASEIDKHAIKQTMLNFPNTIQLGSVTDVDVNKLDKIDLLIGGSPCTNFSFAGKRNGMSTTTKEEIYTLDRYLELKKEGFQFEGESFLFWEYMRILNDIRRYNPNVKFLLENVEMGKKWERILSEAIGIYGVHINSALVTAQNRKRIYWVGQNRERFYYSENYCYICDNKRIEYEKKIRGIYNSTQRKGEESLLGKTQGGQVDLCGVQQRVSKDRKEGNYENLFCDLPKRTKEKNRQKSEQGETGKISKKILPGTQGGIDTICQELPKDRGGQISNEESRFKFITNCQKENENAFKKGDRWNYSIEDGRYNLNTKYETYMYCVCCGKELDYRSHNSVISYGDKRDYKSPSTLSKMQFEEARQNNGRVFDIYSFGAKGVESMFGETDRYIPQPEDRGILLKDILEYVVEDKYYLNDDVIDKLVQHRERHKELGHGFGAKFHNKYEKMQALKVGGKGIDDLVCVEMRGRGENNEQQLEPNTFGKTNALTSVQKDNLIMQLNPSKESGGNQPYQQNRVYDINGIVPSLLAQMSCGAHKILVPYKLNDDNSIFQLPRGNNKGGHFEDKSPTLSSSSWDRNNFLCQRQQKNFKGDNEKANTFLSTSWKGSQANGMTLVEQGFRIRRLTPTECSRLQTIPEWYRWECSDTQAYKMLGNGWTVSVISHIFSYLPKEYFEIKE